MTTIPVSTAPAVKSYLVAQTRLNSDIAADPNIVVFYDGPASGDQPNDIISFGKVEVEHQPGVLRGDGGANWLFELYHVDVTVSIFDQGDPQAADERCMALMSCV